MEADLGAPRTLTRRWLDRPDPPNEVSLDKLRNGLGEHEVIQEAWLLRTLITPAGGVAREQTEIALAFDSRLTPQQGEGPLNATTDIVVELTKLTQTIGLDVQGWVFVNDAIRAVTEQHGLKIYSRAAPSR